MSKKLNVLFEYALISFLCLGGSQLSAQAGPGASVEWSVGPDSAPTVFFKAPSGYVKHYRICIKKPPASTAIEVILLDRTIRIINEVCIDVMSNEISVRMVEGNEAATGIFYLVE